MLILRFYTPLQEEEDRHDDAEDGQAGGEHVGRHLALGGTGDPARPSRQVVSRSSLIRGGFADQAAGQSYLLGEEGAADRVVAPLRAVVVLHDDDSRKRRG